MTKDQEVRLMDGPMVFSFRSAVPEDLDGVRACVEAAFSQYTVVIGQKPAPMLADFEKIIAGDRVLVSSDDSGRIVAVITARLTGHALEIDILAVVPEYQGAGLARNLMMLCEEEARRDGGSEVSLYTNEAMERALGFYRRLGFDEVRRVVEDGYRRVYFKKVF